MYETGPAVWIAFLAYLSLTFVFAWLGHRKARAGDAFMEEFFVAGRSIGPWVIGLTWIATQASGGSFIGVPSLAHSNGYSMLLWIAGYVVAILVGFGLLAQRIAYVGRKSGALTFPDLLRDRYESPAIGIVSGIALVVLYTGYIVAQYVAGARVIEAVLGIPYVWGAIGFAVTVAIYTTYGGFRAVAWTDSFQAIVMLLGVLITVAFALDKVGGMEAVREGLAAQDPALLSPYGPSNFLPIAAAISFFFIWPFAGAGQPSVMTRYLASGDGPGLNRALVMVAFYVILTYPAIITIGLIGRVLVPDLIAPDHAMPATIIAAVPPWLAGFVLAGPMAAIMSTLSSFLLVSASALVRDLYERNRSEPLGEKQARLWTTVATFAVAAIALVFALKPPVFLQYIVVFSGTGLAATFLLPICFSLYWPGMNKTGCMAGILGGFSVFLAQYLAFGTRSFFDFDPFVWSLLASLIFCVVGSRLGTREPKRILQRYFEDAV